MPNIILVEVTVELDCLVSPCLLAVLLVCFLRSAVQSVSVTLSSRS